MLLCCSLQPVGLLTSMGFNIHLIPSGQRGYLQRKSHDSVLASNLRSGRRGPSKDFREQFPGWAKSPGASMLSTSFPVCSFSSCHQSEWDSGEVTEVMGLFCSNVVSPQVDWGEEADIGGRLAPPSPQAL